MIALIKKAYLFIVANILPKLIFSSSAERSFWGSPYISGKGIEIGALHAPMFLPVSANVKYVDHLSETDLRKHYPELGKMKLVPVDYISSGETLEAIEDESCKFVIANHVIEHYQNPLLAIKNFFRVLKEGGILFLAVPNRNDTFDKDRLPTPISHRKGLFKSF